MENITRIVDLPDNSSGPTNTFNPNLQQSPLTNGYVPINLHPNPYGISAQNPIMPPPQQQAPVQQQLSEEQRQQLYQIQQQRLPSRDIPQDAAGHIQDEQVKPNYIPRPKQSTDFVREHEDMTEKNLREYEEKNRKEKKLDLLLTEFQTPIFITILFFFFQLPIINTLIFKKFSFLSIHNSDGNFNMNGLIFKSILFGLFYYIAQKFTTFISEF